MTQYNTGNPIGSTDPRDLLDNAQNLDEALHSKATAWTDRLGEDRQTWTGIQERVNDLIIAGGRIFESEGAGRAMVGDGDYYLVVGSTSDSAIDIWRRVDSSRSDFIASQPSNEETRRLASILAEHDGQPLLEFVLETGEWLGEYNEGGWELGRATVEALTTVEHHIGDSTLKSTPEGAPFQITTEDDDVIAEVDGEGYMGVLGLSTLGGSRITGDYSSDVLTITDEVGDSIIAAIDGSGTLSVSALNVGGYPVYGSPYAEGEAFEYTAPYVPQESIDLINSLNVTDADGAAPNTMQIPPKLSTDRARYGYTYAHLASSVVWTGSRMWVAAYGQNMRPGENGEGDGTFVFLRYCDDPLSSDPAWHEVLYVVPDVEQLEKAHVKDPMLSVLPDGRMLVQVLGRYNTTEETWGFIIQNPEAKRGKLTVGRIYWIAFGVPGRPKQVGEHYLGVYDRMNADSSTIRTLSFPGIDGIKAELFSTVPQYQPLSEKGLPESSFVQLSGARLMYLQRTGNGLAQATTDPGGLTWPNPPQDWTEYPSPATRATQELSPSGRIVRIFNNSTAGRNNLSIAISEDEGNTFPIVFLVQTTAGGKSEVSYPSLDFITKGDEVFITISYDYGRELDLEDGETQVAIVSEDKVVAGTATQQDILYLTAAKTSEGL